MSIYSPTDIFLKKNSCLFKGNYSTQVLSFNMLRRQTYLFPTLVQQGKNLLSYTEGLNPSTFQVGICDTDGRVMT